MKEKQQSIASLISRLDDIETELKQVRSELAQIATPDVNKPSASQLEYTIDDLCQAFGRKHKPYATRLVNVLQQHGIITLQQFLALTPGQLLNLEGIGISTLQYTNSALKRLGIAW